MPRPIYLLLFGVSLTLILSPDLTAQSYYAYPSSTQDIVNPERGMYRYFETRTAEGYTALQLPTLQQLRTQDRQSLIYRIFYLDGFYEDMLSTTVLSNIEQDFATLRAAGVKAIVRFAYTDSIRFDTLAQRFIPPYHDTPDPPLVFTHLSQLGPILAANSDVILTVHNGFYGTWGENYYSDDFGSLADAPITPAQQARRDAVTDSLLKYLPVDRGVSVRYPALKADYLGLTVPDDSLTAATAYQGTPLSRIGFHNDCFLADFNDWTFIDTLAEKPYWATESQYVVMGGESCRDTSTYTNCTNALSELARFHWTYMNDYYHPGVLQRWQDEGCYADIRKKLGYRLVLHEAILPDVLTPHAAFSLQLDLENRGWSAPKLPRPVELVLRSTADQTEYILPLTTIDLRRLPGESRTTYAVQQVLDTQVPVGTYDVYLFLPDARTNLRSNPAFCMRLANDGIWDAATGMHDLGHTLAVEQAPCPIDTLLDEGPLGSGGYWARDCLSVATEVAAGAMVEFRAGSKIRLLPGFSVTGGSEMTAAIQPCSPAPAALERVQVPAPVSPQVVRVGIQAWPNPTSGVLTVSVPETLRPATGQTIDLELRDARGMRVHAMQLSPGERREINLSTLPAGTYFLVWSDLQERHATVILKQ